MVFYRNLLISFINFDLYIIDKTLDNLSDTKKTYYSLINKITISVTKQIIKEDLTIEKEKSTEILEHIIKIYSFSEDNNSNNEYQKWKHVVPIQRENNQVIVSKLIVYGREKEEYYTFITSEAYDALKEWMNFRSSFRENITGETWILRDIWQKTSIRYSHNIGMAKYPKHFKSLVVKTLIGRALQIQGIRKPPDLKNGEKGTTLKPYMVLGSFLKLHERVMKSINVELLLGHNVGIFRSYYKPSENELLEDYLKAVDSLTINKIKNNEILEKEIDELREKNENNEHIIKSKLQENPNSL